MALKEGSYARPWKGWGLPSQTLMASQGLRPCRRFTIPGQVTVPTQVMGR